MLIMKFYSLKNGCVIMKKTIFILAIMFSSVASSQSEIMAYKNFIVRQCEKIAPVLYESYDECVFEYFTVLALVNQRARLHQLCEDKNLKPDFDGCTEARETTEFLETSVERYHRLLRQ